MRPAGTIQGVRMERMAIVSRRGINNATGGLIPTQAPNVETSTVPPIDEDADPVIRTSGIAWIPPSEPE